MNVTCPQCDTTYRVDPAKVPAGGVRARCTQCGEIIQVSTGAPESDESSAGGETAGQAARQADEHRPLAGAGSLESSAGEAPSSELDEESLEGSQGAEGAGGSQVPQGGAGEPGMVTPSAASQVEAEARGAAAGRGTRAGPADGGSAGGGGGATEAAPATSQRPGGVRAAPAFGAADPDAKARRLARALISDIVVYHPERRERSLAAGSLRQDFREEIQKSWEEYVAQVGDKVARGTPHFRDALNELLAGGQRVF